MVELHSTAKIKVLAQSALRMIRLAAEIGIHQAGTVRMRGVALFWFERHEYGINFGEYFRIVAFEGPAPLRLVVGIEDSETSDLFILPFFARPDSVLIVRLLDSRLVQVVRVKEQRLPFGEEDSAESRASLPSGIGIDNVDDM